MFHNILCIFVRNNTSFQYELRVGILHLAIIVRTYNNIMRLIDLKYVLLFYKTQIV